MQNQSVEGKHPREGGLVFRPGFSCSTSDLLAVGTAFVIAEHFAEKWCSYAKGPSINGRSTVGNCSESFT